VFADLVGFTSLNETTDPELVQALVARAFERLSAEAARYEGTIEKFAGDAMLAIFGVPIVHEDDAERAVRAALEMQAAMLDLAAELRAEARPELALRVGVETGEVLVDLGRVEVDRDRMVTGDAVNTAARLQQVAQPGEVLVGSSTYAVTRELVEYEELPPVPLKGKSLPVAAWRAIAVKARRGGRRAPLGIEAPLIGRDEEIALLKETVHRTAVEGRPHLVTVLGSAGVGKSRLTWELEKYLDGLPETYVWRKGRCLAYAQSSYSAFSDAVRADAKILQDDASEAAEAKLDARLLELAGPTPTDGMADALRAVLGLAKPAGLGRDELFDAWRRYLELLSRQAPLVLVQEDVHWADEGLLDFLEYVARWSEGPIVLLCLARHELLERRSTWGGGLPNAATIVLEPLAPDENARMFDRLLDGNLPTEVRDRVVSLADGNPLFTEELVRMFVDKGVVRYADGRWELARRLEDVEIPGSIQAVLAARLDTLPPAEKRATQDAAVVGRIFWDALIAHLMRSGPVAVRDTLRRLRVKELVVPREPSMLAGAAEFGFRHVLTRDVAYESLPKRQRAAKHLDVAHWAEETLADRTEEMVELLASHYLAALRYEEELGGPSPERLTDLRRQTYTYARRAGARASDLHQLEIAARWLAIAIEQAARLEVDAVERASLALEFFHGTVGNVPYERQLAIVQEAVELMEARDDRTADDDQLLGRLRAAAGYCLFQMERLEDARSVLQAGIAALEGPPSAARAELRHRLGWTYWRAGPIETSLPLLRLAVDEAHAVGAADVERWAIHELGVATSKTGDVGTGLALVQESFKLAQDARDHTLIARCHINVPALMNTNGMPWSEWGPIMKAGLETSRRAVDRSSTAWTAENLGDAAWERGTIREAIAYYQEGLEAATALRDELKVTIARLSIGWMHYFMGDYGVVQAVEADRARLAASNPEAQAELYEAMWVAWRRWREDDPPVAIAGLRAAIESAEDVSEVHAPRLLARQALRAGDREALVVAEKYILEVARTAVGPLRRLDTRWVEALRRGGPGAVDDLARIASDWESMEYRLIAADVFADAALIAARDGIEASPLIAAANRLYAQCEVVPVLGPLPEDRWVEPRTGDAVAAPA
jgi:class 3 adenylate cyclase